MGLVGNCERIDLRIGDTMTTSNLSMEGEKNLNSYASVGNKDFNATEVNVLNDLYIIGSVYSYNVSTQKAFSFDCNFLCVIVNTQIYIYIYDLEISKYTTYITTLSG
jgi:hypothetical protein